MIYNAQTQTWEAVLTGVPAQTKIDYKFSYQTDAIQSMQASPPTSYVVDGLAVPLGRRYVDDEMHNQAVTLRWPTVPVPTKQTDPITYEIYSRPVSLDPIDPWEGDWRLLTEQPLLEPEFIHDGLQAGAYYDYLIITKSGPYQSLASPILRAKTDNIYTPPPSEPKIDPEADVPGAWYVLDGAGYDNSKSPILFVQGQGDVAQSWWGNTLHGINDMTSLAAAARYRMAFVQLNDKDSEADNSLEANAALLAGQLAEIYNYFGEKVNVVAHGKGGVDLNYALVKHDAYPYVDKVITLSSPHQGSLAADEGMSLYQQPQQKLANQLNDAATLSMQTANMQQIKLELDEHPNMNIAEIYTVAGDNQVNDSSGGGLSSGLRTGLLVLGIVALIGGAALAGIGLAAIQSAVAVVGSVTIGSAAAFGAGGVIFFGGATTLLISAAGAPNDGMHTEEEVQLPERSSGFHAYTGNFNYDDIRKGSQIFNLVDKVLNCPAGADVLECTGLEEGLTRLQLEETKLPERLTRGGVVLAGEQRVESFPVESGNEGIYVGLNLSTDYAQVELISPSGQTYTKWSEEVQGLARFIPGLDVTQGYWIEEPEAGTWTVEFQTDEMASFTTSVYFDGSEALDLTLSELEQLLHDPNPGRAITIGVNAIRQEPDNSTGLDGKTLADETFYNVTFDISGHSEQGAFERTVVKSYNNNDYQAIIRPDAALASPVVKGAMLEISTQELNAMDPQQLDALLQANR